ncbi:MAG: oxygen-independent coproporphyrinogen III oxidase [Proteiniphilum sp.]|nr:oxygen-independent coproporphyrinogen III oxidase [Proteiniphilum sp.]MDD4158761.1 oxygen-independent coproporphyrinogen III oxidase [Proteiniphilum sp.]MDD4800608.1 oxygen-independent coproporphyrinogen III oxidase [Proteiniphilum sp.]
MNKLIDKYNVPVPRYTSYPPANFFRDEYDEKDLIRAIDASNRQEPSHLSFYIHLPYCNRMCYYCGCNAYPRTKRSSDQEYVDAVMREIQLVCTHIDPKRKIAQIHYGGGSPSTFAPDLIRRINEALFSRFQTIDDPEIAIECHPGYMRESAYEQLADAGFNRMSIGIQDFNTDVLQASNRLPSLLPMEQLFALLRERKIRINLDFIYGLPLQTEKSFSHTVAQAIALAPDRLVTFSYAHMPRLFPRQKLLERKGLPTEELKNLLCHTAQQQLLQGGYRQIGLDHHVKEEDELFRALSSGTLHRNFQGYCARHTTGQVYAFGVTAISQLTGAYAQNTKSIAEYIQTIRSGHIPVMRGYRLNEEEQITREVITGLMCNEEIRWQQIASHLRRSVEEVRSATAYSEEKMKAFEEDGIILWDDEKIVMREKGSPFIRNVAASLDKLLTHTDKTFSKPI